MRHFVQYHNIEREGLPHSDGRPGIFTAKSVQALLGDRIWLICGEGRPRAYYLSGSFEVSELSSAAHQGEMNEAWGRDSDRWFEKPVRIDAEPWFEELRRATGNFAFGLQRIKAAQIIQGLRNTSLVAEQNATETNAHETGGLPFGTAEMNKLVEIAAVKAVTAAYESDGWEVVSHENRRSGYDLYCAKSQAVHHVEVKGARGRDCSFIITANEMDFLTSVILSVYAW